MRRPTDHLAPRRAGRCCLAAVRLSRRKPGAQAFRESDLGDDAPPHPGHSPMIRPCGSTRRSLPSAMRPPAHSRDTRPAGSRPRSVSANRIRRGRSAGSGLQHDLADPLLFPQVNPGAVDVVRVEDRKPSGPHRE